MPSQNLSLTLLLPLHLLFIVFVLIGGSSGTGIGGVVGGIGVAVILILVAIIIVLVVMLTKKGTSDWQMFAYCIHQLSQLCFLPLMSSARNILYISIFPNKHNLESNWDNGRLKCFFVLDDS